MEEVTWMNSLAGGIQRGYRGTPEYTLVDKGRGGLIGNAI